MTKRIWFNVKNEANSDAATVYIYGVIGKSWWNEDCVGALDFAKELAALGSKTLNIRINSRGGDVIDGIAIGTAIRNYPGTTHGFIDAVAASAASFVALQCDDLTIAKNGFFMIHKAWTSGSGNADDFRLAADQLDMHDANIASYYVESAGQDAAYWLEKMMAEKWLTAEEALAEGLVDSIDSEALATAACISEADARLFGWKNMPAELLASDTPPNVVDEDVEPEADGSLELPEADALDVSASTAKTYSLSSGIYTVGKETNV